MSKILKNNTDASIFVTDTGITIPVGINYTIQTQDYLLWASSSNVITYVANGSLTVNDGSNDLTIAQGIDLIRGAFPTQIKVLGSSITGLSYDDMNASNGGVARNSAITTSYSTIYSRSGTGSLFNFLVTFEGNLLGADPFTIKLMIDSSVVLEISTLDMGTSTLYNIDGTSDSLIVGLQLVNNTIKFKVPGNNGLKYNSNITIQIKKTSGNSKKFRAGLVVLTKE